MFLSWLLFDLKSGFDGFSHIFPNICVEKAIKVEIDGRIADFQQVGNNAELLYGEIKMMTKSGKRVEKPAYGYCGTGETVTEPSEL